MRFLRRRTQCGSEPCVIFQHQVLHQSFCCSVKRRGVKECFTEEHHPVYITISFLCLFIIKVFLSARFFFFFAITCCPRISKQCPASVSPILLEKNRARHLCLLKVPRINFSSSQLSAIVICYINQMMVAVCNKGVHKHGKYHWKGAEVTWTSALGVHIHLFIYFHASKCSFFNQRFARLTLCLIDKNVVSCLYFGCYGCYINRWVVENICRSEMLKPHKKMSHS